MAFLAYANSMGGPSYSPFSQGVGTISTIPCAEPQSNFMALGRSTPVGVNPADTLTIEFEFYQSNYNSDTDQFTLPNGLWRIEIAAQYEAGGGGEAFEKPDFYIRDPPPATNIYRLPKSGDSVSSGNSYYDLTTLYLNTFVEIGQPAFPYEVCVRNNGAAPATINVTSVQIFCTRVSTINF